MDKDVQLAELTALTSQREAMYRLLSRLYEGEIDADLLNQMRLAALPSEECTPELLAGYGLLRDYLESANETAVADLASQFARIFLGAAPREGDGAFPYESVYRGPEHRLMQAPQQQVAELYREAGLERVPALDHLEDHIALELAFMAHLCQETSCALEAGDADELRVSLTRQSSFLDEHLVSWVPTFCSDVERLATTDFYKGVARITSSFLAMDQELIKELADRD